jgi:dipeptidyl aminopeptidase/acylaminoacyl peptidase
VKVSKRAEARCKLKLALLALAGAAFAQTPPKALTIDQLMSAPFPSNMTAAPSGGHVAWVQNAAGVRNIWIATAPDYAAKAITAFNKDDGQEIGPLVWTADAGAIFFVRGTGPNRAGEIPNPTSDPAGAEQAVWVVPAAGGEPKKLGEGSAPEVSKSGRVAWISKGQVWSAAAEGSAKAEPLFKVRGTASSLRWSPDGNQLAFVSERGDHSFVGVYDLAGKSLHFLGASVDSDSEPAWSPDGKQIAFLRLPAGRDRSLFSPIRTGDPWSIQVADAATGEARQVFIAEAGRGSVFHPMTAPNQVLWASSGQLVFPWERDGWLHLYSVSVTGGTAGPRLLTFGEFEIEDARLTSDGREVLFSSNSDDVDRRHLFRVPAAGGAVTPLTSGKGIEWSPVMTSDGKALAFFRSDAKLPARAAVMAAFGAPRDLTPLEFPAEALVEPQPVVITAADGMKIRCQLFASPSPEKRPAVLFFHGGSRRQMLLGWHYMSYYHATYAMNQWLASKGYIVLSVNYRSGTGYGLDFREATNFGASGAAEFNDVMGAGLYLQSRPDVDSSRIGIWGGSYGGYLTALGLARASNLFAAGVDIHGVHDWNHVIPNFLPGYSPSPDSAKLAFESSPMASVRTWKSPVLLIHGDDDRNVPFSESVSIAAALRKQGVDFEQLIFPDEIHGFLRHSRWLEVFRAAGDFLDRRLKKK